MKSRIWVDVRKALWYSLSIEVNLGSWIATQLENPTCLLRALTRAPGIYFALNGSTYGRAAMLDFEGATQEGWIIIPHPLQVIDSAHGMTWYLLGPDDYYEAAAWRPPSLARHGTDIVNLVTGDPGRRIPPTGGARRNRGRCGSPRLRQPQLLGRTGFRERLGVAGLAPRRGG